MTHYVSPDNRTSLDVDHDAHGCTILRINPNPGSGETKPFEYGIPSIQLPHVLFDMTGDAPTQDEQEAAEEFLNGAIANGATTEDLISSVRNTILALQIHTVREDDALEAEGTILDEYDTMDPDELREEARNLRTENHKLLEGREHVLNKLNATQRELSEVRKVLLAIHGAIGKVANEEARGNAS